MLKSGDRVKIREYLVGTTKEMRSFAGKMVTVDKAGDDTFSIMEDYGRGTWHVSMLQDASLVEGLVSTAYRNYEIPKDPAKLMYDFYFLTSYLDPKTLKLIDPETGEEIASLYDEELWSIKYLYSTIVNTLCSKLKMALKFSMSCEARHVFDRNTNLDHIDPKIAKFLAIFYRERGLDGNIDRYKDTQLFKNIPGYQTNRKIMNRADLSDESNLIGDSSEFKTSFVAFQRAQKECRLSDYEVGKIMEFCFEKLDWNSSYGGTPWADIARGFLMLNAADNGSDEKQLQLEDLSYLGPKIAAIDHAYDLQHNTGSAFNKLRTYASGGGYDWLLNNLDFKRFSIDVKDYYPIVSPALRPLVGWVSQRYHGESMEQYWDQYQVGERVVIKPNLHVSRKDHGAKKFGDYHLSVDSEMARYAGKVAVIMKVDDRKSGLKVFHLNVDQSNNSWTNDMFVKFSNKEERDDYLAKNPQPEEEVPVATGEETGFESAEVGDKVKVANLHGKDSVMGVAVTDTMMQLSGIKYVISEITTLDKIWGGSYPAIPAFKLRGWDYIWTTGMFVPGSLEKKNPPIASGEASASLAADLPMDISFNSQDEEITLFTFIQNKFPDILWKAGQKPLDYMIQGFPNGINISTNKQLTVSEDSETAIPYGTFIKKYSGGNGNTGKTQSSDYVTEMKERLNFPKANIAILITSRDEGNMTIPYVKKVFPTFQVWGTTPEEGFNNPDALAKLPYYFMIEAVGNSASYGYQDYVDQRSTKNYLKQYNYTTFTAEEFIEMSKEVEKKVSGAGGSLPSYDSLGLPKPWFIYFPSKESAKEGLKVMGNYPEITWVSGQNPDAFYPENPDADGPVCLGFGFSGGKPHLGWMKGDEYGKNYYKEKGGTEIHLADLLKGGATPEPKEPTTSHAIGESLVVKDSEDNEFVISEKGDLFIVGVVEDEKTYDKVSGILSKVMPKLTWGGGYDLLNHKPNEYPCWLYVYTDIPEGTTTYNKLKMYQSGSRSYVKKSLRGDRWENLIPPQNLVDAYTDASISAEAGSGEPVTPKVSGDTPEPTTIGYKNKNEMNELLEFFEQNFPEIKWSAGQKPTEFDCSYNMPGTITLGSNMKLTTSTGSGKISVADFIAKYSSGSSSVPAINTGKVVDDMKSNLDFPAHNVGVKVSSIEEAKEVLPYILKVFPGYKLWGGDPFEKIDREPRKFREHLPLAFMISQEPYGMSYGYQDGLDGPSTVSFLERNKYKIIEAKDFINLYKSCESGSSEEPALTGEVGEAQPAFGPTTEAPKTPVDSLVVKDQTGEEFVLQEGGDIFVLGPVRDTHEYIEVIKIIKGLFPQMTWAGGNALDEKTPSEFPNWLYFYTGNRADGCDDKNVMYQCASESYVNEHSMGRWSHIIDPKQVMNAYNAKIELEAISESYRSDIVPITEGIVTSAYSHYSPPKDPAKLMYDFYFLTSYLNPETFHITDPKTGEEVGSVYDEELWSLKYMYYSITEHMYKHMKSALKYSIACEMRHLFDKDVGSYPEPIMRFLATFRRNLLIQNGVYDSGYSFLKHDPANIPKRRLMKRGILPQEDRAVSKSGDDSYRQCFLAMQRACKELGIDDLTYAQYTKKCFLENDWNGSYGGKNWANISAGLEMLIKADKGPITQSLYSPGALDFLNDKIVAIDHAYDLVHNTGSVFTKLKAYNRESGYRWIEKNLDFKRFSIDVRDYADVVSPELKPLVGWFSQLIGNGSIEQYDDLYSKGSIVVIKPNLQYSTKDRDRKIAGNYHLEVDDSMKMYAGKVAQITSMDTQPSGLRVFSLDIDHGANSWTNDMFVDMRNAENRETYQKVIDSYAEEVAAREAEEKVKAENRKERNLAIKLGAPQKNFVVLNVVTEDELSNVKKLVAKISGGSPVTWFTSVSIDEPPYEGFHLPADIYVNVSNLNSGVSEVMATADVGRYDSYKEMYPVAFSTEDIELMVGDKVKIEDHEPYTIGPVTKDNLDEVATKLEELYGSKVKWEYGGTPSETPSSVNKFLESDPLFLEMKYSGSVVYIKAMASKYIDPLYSVTDFLKGVLVTTPPEEMGGVVPFSKKEETEGKPKLKVGDKVYISPKFGKEGKDYPFGETDTMVELAGKVATITAASSSIIQPLGCYKYKINLDGGHWNWSWPMFAGIVSSDGPGPEGGKKEQKPEVAYEEGTTVTIRPDLSVMDKDMGIVVVAPMVELAGKKAHITNRTANTLEGNIYAKYLYKLDIDDGTYYWSYLMFTDDQNDRERDRRRDEDDDRRLPTGTKVKIKDDFTARGQRYDAYVDEEMERYAGKEATITDSDSTTPFYYSLDIDWGGNSWTSDMFDVVDGHIHGEEKKGGAGKPLPDGTKVHILDEFEKGKEYKAGLVRPDMTDLAGSDATITKSQRFSDHYSYSLDIDHGEHYWSTDMFTVTNSSDEDKATSPGTNVGTKDNPKHVYDVGDTVEIIPDLSTDMTEDVVGVDVLYSMLVFAGKKATITKVTKKLYESDTNGPYYTLDVDDGACYWTSDLFVHDDGPIDETPLKEGTEVTVNPDLTEAGGSKMGISVTKEMEKYAGKTGHITFSKENAHHPDVTKYLYELDLDNGYFYWTDKMFTVNG